MKKYKLMLDGVLLVLLILLCLATIAPHTIVMPNPLQMVLLLAVFGLISTFLVIVWKEKPDDEREAENQHFASRLAYLTGCVTLIVVMLAQGLSHHLDAAIPVTLLIMIVTKILAQQFKDRM